MDAFNPIAWINGFKKENARVRQHSGRSETNSNRTEDMSNTTTPLLARAGISAGRTKSRGEDPVDVARDWIDQRVKRAAVSGKFAEFGLLTPDIAGVLLERNPENRKVSEPLVGKWAAALLSEDWEDNGETIKIAATGELNDGQHRSLAVVRTGVSMPVVFTFGTTRTSRKTVDVGNKRTAAHMFGMAGVPNAALSASALKMMLNIVDGVHLRTDRSFQELNRALQDHPDILQRTASAKIAARQFRQSAGMFIALHYLFALNHPEKSDGFFDMLAASTAPTQNHPVARLRSRLTDDLGNKAKLPVTEVAALTIKAMQSFVANKPVSILRWISKDSEKGGKIVKAEPFPAVP